ncbi:IS30 family transposase [Gelidibacter gilvus]|uniref:IS30 family transposase n=1 Tax=Gelidibacter gilvus TaxID=59602 RepID=A0A4Q0XC80_9FLAO|nr:IS30 family transposase [Gelidibacter gilvus]RXJ44324.1 IS30 family transposase [Gelidibacter gilvus]
MKTTVIIRITAFEDLGIENIGTKFRNEFAGDKDVADAWQIDFYFSNPCCSWKCVANENFSGLIRQYFPKKTDFSSIMDKRVPDIMEKLNNGPRKDLVLNTIEVVVKLLLNTEAAFFL